MTFTNQVAIITGAGEGIGYEIARHLAHQGASIILNDINAERAKQADLHAPNVGENQKHDIDGDRQPR